MEGVACLIDALPLAQACAALSRACRERGPDAVSAAWPALEQAMLQLKADIEKELQKIPQAL
ncbi:hypothetical protein D3C81_2291360 [compost metagenome]